MGRRSKRKNNIAATIAEKEKGEKSLDSRVRRAREGAAQKCRKRKRERDKDQRSGGGKKF